MQFITLKFELGQGFKYISVSDFRTNSSNRVLRVLKRPEVGWSGPATLKLVGDKDQTETIAIEGVRQSKIYTVIIIKNILDKVKKELRL